MLAGAAPTPQPADGWRAYSDGKFPAAVAIWSQAAGNADAQFGLGLAYDLGRGVAQDEARACLWYRRAALGGVAAAAFNLAIMFDQARCGPRDPAKAAEWYARAAATGYARAEYDLAQLYELGDGVPKNLDEAQSWYQAASVNGIAAAIGKVTDLNGSKPARSGKVVKDGAGQDAALQPVLTVTPSGPDQPDLGVATPFVWTVPPQPQKVRFFLEVDAVEEAGLRPVVARYADRSATLAALPPGSGDYAWRVFTVGAEGKRYVPSAWRRFQVDGRASN